MRRRRELGLEELRGMSDEELIGLIARRDEAALRVLFLRYAPYLLAMARRMMPKDEAKESLLDAFVKVWEESRSFDPAKANVRTWLVTVVHRLMINRLNRRQAPSAELGREPQVPEGGDGLPSFPYLPSTLERADPLARQLLELAFFGGHDHRRLARLSGRSPATVEDALRRALAALQLSWEELA